MIRLSLLLPRRFLPTIPPVPTPRRLKMLRTQAPTVLLSADVEEARLELKAQQIDKSVIYLVAFQVSCG